MISIKSLPADTQHYDNEKNRKRAEKKIHPETAAESSLQGRLSYLSVLKSEDKSSQMGHYLLNRPVICHKIGLGSMLKVGAICPLYSMQSSNPFCNGMEERLFQSLRECKGGKKKTLFHTGALQASRPPVLCFSLLMQIHCISHSSTTQYQ